jgi:hypothetical protein
MRPLQYQVIITGTVPIGCLQAEFLKPGQILREEALKGQERVLNHLKCNRRRCC